MRIIFFWLKNELSKNICESSIFPKINFQLFNWFFLMNDIVILLSKRNILFYISYEIKKKNNDQ